MANPALPLLQQAHALHQAGRLDEADAAYRAILAQHPREVHALALLGTLRLQRGKIEDAIELLGRALRLNPREPTLLNNRGHALERAGRHDEALKSYAKAVALKPDYAEAHFNRGNTLRRVGRQEEALAAYDQAIRLNPRFAPAMTNRGNALRALGRPADALASYDEALALAPQSAEAHDNRGVALEDLLRCEEALSSFDRAIALDPSYAEARANKGLLLLRLGDFERGWPLYEWRWRSANFTSPQRNFAAALWDGADAAGSTILLHAEQGLGDSILFCRYAPLVAARGAKVILEMPRALGRLMRSLSGADAVIATGDAPPAFDRHAPLLSLPGIFHTSLATVPAAVPYLSAEPALIEKWRARLPAGFRIGINWQGNPAGKVEKGRSAPLAAFAPLAQLPGVQLVSLQKTHGLDQLAHLPAGMSVATLGEDFDSGPDAFLDTAAVMMSLDLVVTIDSSIGHVAGALGRPVWLALQAVPYWVWMLDRADSPWYPSMRLFRQARGGAWSEVFERMGAELKRLRQ